MAVAVARNRDVATSNGRVSRYRAVQRRPSRNGTTVSPSLTVLAMLILTITSATAFAQSDAASAASPGAFVVAQNAAALGNGVPDSTPSVTSISRVGTNHATFGAGPASEDAPNIAFFSGHPPPVDALQAFDAVVLDPTTGFDPLAHPLAHTLWIARTRGQGGAGGANASTDAFVANVIEPLWQKGYRGFLLDTSYAIAATDRIHVLHPDARLIIGGAAALQNAAPYAASLYAVVGDALIQGLTAASPAGSSNDQASLSPVPDALRMQRASAARAFTAQTGVPVISEEFCASADRQCARDTAAKVVADGVTPYVTRPAEDIVGIGRIEVLPRKVLIIQDAGTMDTLDISPGVRNVAMPLNYLGYDVQYADMNTLPDDISPDRYAGVVVWLEGDTVPNELAWQSWVAARIGEHIPVAFFGHFGFDAAVAAGSALDMQPVAEPLSAPITEVIRDPMVGFEIDPKPDARDIQAFRVGSHSRALLTLSANGTLVDEVAITPWGGYAMTPYTVVWVDGIEQKRWAIQPLDFLKAALQLPALPSPSVTTENGRRLLMSHVDGDGFASRAEFPGADYSGQALYDRIFSRYPVPMALSVIEGEVGPQGLHPAISPRLEQIARAMFALPNVEIGSHTYSHPFIWQDVDPKSGTQDDDGGGDAAFSLNIPGYHFYLDREISGSLRYIDSRLAPSGKKADLLQWSGNCRPPAVAIRRAYEAGVYNLNGGDTMITRSANTWTYIAPIGIDKGPGAYQVYAPNQDENVYTTNWQGPYYGFTRVLETFAMTDAPYRFKPIDIYYHMYSGTKLASLRALDEIFTTVLQQPVMPIYVHEYIRKVLDWRSFAVAREIETERATDRASQSTAGSAAHVHWIVRGNGAVRELHWPQDGMPTLTQGNGVTGFSHGPDGTYIHIADGTARFALDANANGSDAGKTPYIAEADGVVRQFSRTATGMRFEFAGHYQPFVKFANAQSCRVTVNGHAVIARRDGEMLRFDTPASVEQQMNFQSVELTCGR